MDAAQSKTPRYERAVVIGASMGGLAVARALSDHFREVVLVERDTLTLERPEHRPSVAQSWHIHGLTIGGQRELESLFPGFVETAVSLGAMQVDDGGDYAVYGKYGWAGRVESDFICLSATRILLEFAQRKCFFALVKNARLLSATQVTDLLIDKQGGRARVTGVATNHPDEPEIRADFVVDCSGRRMAWKSWFKKHEVALPKETIVDSRCAYSSRFYRPRDPADFNWTGMVVDSAFPERPHWGVIIPLEHNDWVVTLGGFNGNYPPADEKGFMDFARALPAPQFAQALERADPLTKVRAFRRLEMRWNHFETFNALSHFMAIGDSAWSYNPLYGQGMSVAATCGRILRDVLAKDADLDTLPHRYYPPAREFALPLWTSTAALDMRWPGTTGQRSWHHKISEPVGEMMVRAAGRDPQINLAVLQVVHLIKTPAMALMNFMMLWRLFRYVLRELFFGPPKLEKQMQPPPPGRVVPKTVGTAGCCACSERHCRCLPSELSAVQAGE
jgi:flavin-dependent dehydrogenase